VHCRRASPGAIQDVRIHARDFLPLGEAGESRQRERVLKIEQLSNLVSG
jgi:hypothetical protein